MNEEDDYTCDPNDDDSAYDAWADNRVEEFFKELRDKSYSDTENSDMFRLRKGTFRKYFNINYTFLD